MESLVAELAGREALVNALSDVDLSKHLAEWLEQDLGIARWKVLLGLKLITPVVVSVAKGAGKMLADGIKQQLLSQLIKRKWAKDLIDRLNDFSSQTSQKTEAMNQVKAQLERPANRAEGDVEHREALSLELQAMLRQMGALEEVQDTLDFLVNLVNLQPAFKDTYAAENDRQQFVYRSQYIPFAGRVAEMATLDEFLNCPKRFAWKSVTGPGGVGKSRLALEFCQRNGGAWRAGILLDTGFDFAKWQPNQPTLIVIDYATKEEPRLKEILELLTNRRGEFDYAVRVLLLERDKSMESLAALGEDDEYGRRHHGPDIVLGEGGEEIATSIFAFFFDTHGVARPDSWDAHLTKLQEIDARRRPLFAAYYANEVATGKCGRECDRESLLQSVIKREKEKFWDPSGVTEADLALLAFATMVGGVTNSHELPECVTPISELVENEARFLALGGIAVKHDERFIQIIRPWEPDLVGELFVLDFLSDKPRALSEHKYRATLLKTAWDKAPLATAAFLDRLRQDYADHPAFPSLIKVPADAGEQAALYWAMLAVNMLSMFGRSGDMQAAQQQYADILAYSHDLPTNQEVSVIAAQASVNIIKYFGEIGDLQAAKAHYADIAVIKEGHPDNQEIDVRQAMAAFNLTTYFGKDGDFLAAEKSYADIVALRNAYPENQRIAMAMINSVVNLISYIGEAVDSQRAKDLYADIVEIWRRHSENQEIAEAMAKATCNFIKEYDKDGDTQAVGERYADISAIRENYPNNPSIAVTTARAASNYIAWLGKAEVLQAARERYSDIAAIRKDHPENQEVAEAMMQAAFNLINYLNKAGDTQGAEERYSDIAAIREEYPNNRYIAVTQARAAAHLIDELGQTRDFSTANKLYAEIASIRKDYPEDSIIAVVLAKAAFNLIYDLAKAGELSAAGERYGELKKVRMAHLGSQDIAQTMAQAAINLILYYCRGGDFSAARSCYNDVAALRTEQPDNCVMAVRQAMAALNLSIGQIQQNEMEYLPELVRELRGLEESHAGEQDVDMLIQRANLMAAQLENRPVEERNEATQLFLKAWGKDS
ncbi:hypothetical protein GM415_02995 [Pseudodesulfovibrio cashew]|uniref:Tetratricopeptide repeat protein n=1 Tax=Pseudodesulfovibrio cashew TaxID=2678688 RepID=A0A6I6JFE4_9BACT|nr:hypothetical protein [Pseudodesulfovibrio cashew]QGY39132.1 hypothetical protein GM415_02995 [Pseudodesulfovibrio cashew]